jgi:hypothetical protein
LCFYSVSVSDHALGSTFTISTLIREYRVEMIAHWVVIRPNLISFASNT